MRLKQLANCSWGLRWVPDDEELLAAGLAFLSARTGFIHVTVRGVEAGR
jgi:hypothetical protein